MPWVGEACLGGAVRGLRSFRACVASEQRTVAHVAARVQLLAGSPADTDSAASAVVSAASPVPACF